MNNEYNFKRSSRKHKKYDVYKNGKYITSFGDTRYEHYKDRLGAFKNLNHGNEKRRQNYLKRAKAIKDKNGKLTWMNPMSANYYAVRFLW
jgi:hypothetical protein